MPSKDIYDPIHGYIHLSDEEVKMLDHPAVQRLRRIRQLGLANMVYPGAEHTRFSHSLGAMHIITKMCEKLSLRDSQKKLLRMAALLHDVGHYPLSHHLEEVMRGYDEKEASHEKFSEEVIKKTDLSKLLNNNLESDVICKIITGRYDGSDSIVLNNLITSELDADRIDYLMRDSYYTGIAYGKFDFDRILYTMKLLGEKIKLKSGKEIEGPRIVIADKAIFALENYMLARLHMYETIYTHKSIRGFAIIFAELYRQIAEESDVLPNFQELKEMDLDKFYCFDDNYVLSTIMRYQFKDDDFKKLQDMLKHRIPLKMIWQERKPKKSDEASAKWHILRKIYKNKRAFCNENNLSPYSVFIDRPSVMASKYEPYIEIYEEKTPEDYEEAIHIYYKDETVEPLVSVKNSIVHDLSKFNLDILRLYTIPEKASVVKEILERELSQYK
ncbi:MAG: HD domain-containing protein [Thermodesulfovibrionales bacterium]|nr:HD domain-containing protein [Thermodesulfovibrionales bacterium]